MNSEAVKLRRLVKLAIVVILLLVASLAYTAVRHAQAMDGCYIPGETIRLEPETQPAIMTTSLVHWKHRRRWNV